eukprot:gene1061-498_t
MVLLDADGHVKLTDFGMSKEGVTDNFSARSLCGTPDYFAPEMLEQTGHGKAVDWYSLGALIFEMCTGLPPYYTRNRWQMCDRIRKATLVIPSYVSIEAHDLMRRLLLKDPTHRLGAGPGDVEDIKSHIFYRELDWEKVYRRQYPPPFTPKLDDKGDVAYFEQEFLDMPCTNSEIMQDLNPSKECAHFEGFAFGYEDSKDSTPVLPYNHPGRRSGVRVCAH